MLNKDEKKLSPEKEQEFFKFGEKVADMLKLKERVEKINVFGNKKPRLFFGVLFSVIIVLFIISFVIPWYKNYDEAPIKQAEQIVNDMGTNSELEFKNNMMEIYNEMELITDTLVKLMDKKNLTHEDSVFMIEKYAQLEKLNEIINEKITE